MGAKTPEQNCVSKAEHDATVCELLRLAMHEAGVSHRELAAASGLAESPLARQVGGATPVQARVLIAHRPTAEAFLRLLARHLGYEVVRASEVPAQVTDDFRACASFGKVAGTALSVLSAALEDMRIDGREAREIVAATNAVCELAAGIRSRMQRVARGGVEGVRTELRS